MFPSKCVVRWLAILILLGLAMPPPGIGHAQAPSQLVINSPELTDLGDGGLQLGLYFTITDSEGRVVPGVRVQAARIQLDDGEMVDNAAFEQPTSPFFIALVLDASGSMAPAATAMREAAIQAIGDAPEQAQFAVIRFNDSIDVLQDFTSDRNRATNAVGDVQPVNLKGTCLYDAAYRAIEVLSNAPAGRRAVVVFTDGTDRLRPAPDTTPCSTHTFGQVVDYATQSASRVPIHTIGLRTGDLNPTELRNMAVQTGGLSAVGEQAELKTLFGDIMNALKSQWLATGVFFPARGMHTATLIVTLTDGTRLSASTQLEVPRDFAQPQTPTPTPTPIVVGLEILSARWDQGEDMLYLEVRVRGEQAISSYRFDFFDANNQLLDSKSVPKPLPSPVAIAALNLSGKLRVELRALDREGEFIAWPGERDQAIDKATYDFTILRPTPTPPPVPPTEIPVEVIIDSIGYDQETDTITLNLTLIGKEQIGGLQINVVDAKTSQLKTVYNADVTETVPVGAEGLEPLKDYRFQVIAQSPSGQNLTRSNVMPFVYTPKLTPTPAPTATPTLTPTPEPVEVVISVRQDEQTREFIFTVQVQNEDLVASYKLQLRDKSGLVKGEYVYEAPLRQEIRLPELEAGDYTAVMEAYGPDGKRIETGSVTFSYTVPPTPTPLPSPTPTASPTPTPAPGAIEKLTDNVRDNPILALVIALIGFALVVVLFLLVRPRKKSSTGTGFLAEQTGFYQMPSGATGGKAAGVPGAAPAPPVSGAPPGPDAEATNVYTDVFEVLATLEVRRSPAMPRIGASVAIPSVPFRIGRGTQQQNDLTLQEDSSVSRSHAVITAEGGRFTITDLGSANGTRVDGVRITAEQPYPLHAGAVIWLGKGTEMVFYPSTPDSGTGPAPRGGDMARTDYVDWDQHDKG